MPSKRSSRALEKSRSLYSAAGQDRTSIPCRTRVIHRGVLHGDRLMARQIQTQTQTRIPSPLRTDTESRISLGQLSFLNSTEAVIRTTALINTADITDDTDLAPPIPSLLWSLLLCRHRCHGTLIATNHCHIRTTRRSTAPILPSKAQEQRPQS